MLPIAVVGGNGAEEAGGGVGAARGRGAPEYCGVSDFTEYQT